jgi:hypothetical protein
MEAAGLRYHPLMRHTVLTILSALALVCSQTGGRAADPPGPAAYTRVTNPDTNTVQLQIALRKFLPSQGPGPAVWLVAVMHVGEPSYYQALQRFLDAQTVVLYEGVDADAHPRHVHDSPSDPAPRPKVPKSQTGANSDYSMQSALAHSLGLVFQLDAIDYDRTNFLNSDLSLEQLARIMNGNRPPGPASGGTNGTSTAPLAVLLQIMDGSSFLGSLFKMGLQFIESNPQVQAAVKLGLIDAIGNLKGDLSEIQGVPPDWQHLIKILIKARNENVIKDAAEELKKIPVSGSVAIFYGAGHMDDMEKRVTGDLHYHAADDIWLPAFSVDMQKSGITPAQADWMRTLIKGEMEQLQSH